MLGPLGVTYQGSKKYTLAGQSFPASGTFTRPANFKSPTGVAGKCLAQCWAGSGGSRTNGGGAGAPAYAEGEVTPGATETVTVATDVAADTDGGNTSFGSLVVAEAGRSGTTSIGGLAANSTGTTKYNGGDGSNGTGTRGGGVAAGSTGAGTAASGSTAGTPGTPDGGYSQLPGTACGWPGGAPGSTAGASAGGRAGCCCSLWATAAPEWTTTQNNAANADPPSHSNSFGSRATLYLVAVGLDSSAGPAISALPTGYGPLVFQPAFEPNGTLLALTWKQAVASSENPGAWGSTNEQHWAATLAIPGQA